MGQTNVPGYAGYRSIIKLEGMSFPAIRLYANGSDPELRFNFQGGLQFERVLSRRLSAGLSVRRLKTRLHYTAADSSGLIQIRSTALGAFLQHYTFRSKGNPAPLGLYQKLEVQWVRYQLHDQDRTYFSDGREDIGSYSDLGINVGIGAQRIFHPRITFHTALIFGTVLGMPTSRSKGEQQELKRLATERLQGHFFINLNIGIGILLR